MSLNQLWSLLPSRRTLVTVATFRHGGRGSGHVRCCSTGDPAINLARTLLPHITRSSSLSAGPIFRSLVSLTPRHGKKEPSNWTTGGGISAALDTVSKTWSANRTKLYDHVLTPEFSKIVAESVKDADLTAAERSAMAAAWRGLSLGLRK